MRWQMIAYHAPDIQIVYPVHLPTECQRAGQSHSGACENVSLIDPREYLPFVWLMNHARPI